MVQALISLIERSDFNAEDVMDIFTSFSCKQNKEVENFLVKNAIPFEKQNLSRTYLLLNDKSLKTGIIKIDGYFSLSVKPLTLHPSVSKSIRKKMSKDSEATHISGYLLGQVARDDSTYSGFGKELIHLAIQTIKVAQKAVGGRFVYLDCKAELQGYYEKMGFTYAQANEENSSYIQMYAILK